MSTLRPPAPDQIVSGIYYSLLLLHEPSVLFSGVCFTCEVFGLVPVFAG